MQGKPVTLQKFYELPRIIFFDSSPAYHLLAPSNCKLRLGIGGYSCSFPAMRPKPLIGHAQRRRLFPSKAHVIAAETDQPKWWEKNAGPNMTDIHSTQEFLDALSQAGNRLVVVDFFGAWCASCRAVFPKICRIAEEHPEILFLKVNFDENKPLCGSLNIKVLPYFQFYRGANGLLDSFSCSLAKLQKLKDAIALHSKGDDDSHADYSGCSSDLSETSTVPEYKFL